MSGAIAPHRHGCHAAAGMPWTDARALAHRMPASLPIEVVPLHHAAGRILGLPVTAASMLPGFDNAAMDGYAVHGSGPWRLVGQVLAGDPAPAALRPGQAVEIATGAPTPTGTDRVVEYEATTRLDDVIAAAPGSRRHLRRAGEYVDVGHEILSAGHPLTPAALGLAASVGIDTVTVRAQPRVRLVITGDEVITHGLPAAGMVRDAIGPMITALAGRWGAAPAIQTWFVPDRPDDALRTALTDGIGEGDITVVCGASSVGAADGLHSALHTIGAVIHIDGVACRPGHPQVLAQVGNHWIVGLPGNPFAALVAACTVLQPLLTGLAAQPLPALPAAHLHDVIRPTPEHTRLIPVRWQHDHVHAISGATSGYLGPAAHADALAILLPTHHNGTPVQLLPLRATSG
jgi:molybdopterin molybdotransferase